MFYVIRKMTGKVVGRKIPDDSLELYLRVLPSGVYGIENSDGNEVAEATVCNGCATFKVQFGPV